MEEVDIHFKKADVSHMSKRFPSFSNAYSLSEQDILRLREDTPGAQRRIHFDNAGCSLSPQPVLEAVQKYLREEAEVGGYALESTREADLRAFYANAAELIGARPEEIAFQGSATLAWYNAFDAIEWRPGDEIITTEYEYGSNVLGFLRAQEVHGIKVRVIPAAPMHAELLKRIRESVGKRSRAIAISHIPSGAGYVHPAAEIGAIAREHGLLYFLDACQSVGQMPIDVEAIGCDVLAATGRKYLRGPRGTGFLYVREASLGHFRPLHPDLWNATQTGPEAYVHQAGARRFETYEGSRALQVGLSAALRYLLDTGQERIWSRVKSLAQGLRGSLQSIPGLRVADEGEALSGIVTFEVTGMDHSAIQQILRKRFINVSVAPAASTYHYMSRIRRKSLIRASVHAFNTSSEIQKFCIHLGDILA